MNPTIVLTLGAFVLGTELFVIAGILPALAHDLGVGIPAAGQLVTAFALTYAVGAPLLATLTGAVPRRRLLTASMSGFALANLLAALAPGYATMLLARIAAALSSCLFFPTALALAAHMAPAAKRGRALALVMLGLNVSTVLGVPVGIALSLAWGWRWVFGAISLGAILVALAVRLWLPEVPLAAPTSLPERIAVLWAPDVARGLALTAAVLLSVYAVYTYLSPILLHRAGLHSPDIARLLLVFGATSAAGAWLGGWLTDRLGSEALLKVTLAVLAATMTGFSFAAHSFASCAVLLGLWGLFGGAFNPAQQHRLLGLAPAHPSAVLAWNSSSVYLGQALAAASGGALLHLWGPDSLGWASGIFLALAATVLLQGHVRPASVG